MVLDEDDDGSWILDNMKTNADDSAFLIEVPPERADTLLAKWRKGKGKGGGKGSNNLLNQIFRMN